MKSKKNYVTKVVAILTCLSLLGGCSVFMAAKQGGVEVQTLAACKTRVCLIQRGARPIDSTRNKSGVLTSEIFQAQVATGSAARAAMHGVLDVATFGLWEVAGTPIEGVQNREKLYSVEVQYAADGKTIKGIKLL